MRCPYCGQKDCCGAELAPEVDKYKTALEKIASFDLGEGGCKRIAREALADMDKESCACDPAYGVKCAHHVDEEDRASR